MGVLHESVSRDAVTDDLTGLSNKRRFRELLGKEAARAYRFRHDLSLLMLDIDNFKQVNDTYGHLQGDIVLRAVADAIAGESRGIDEPARYGGEEFAVVLPETSLAGAVALAEAIRQKVREHVFVFEGDALRLTISVGAAVLAETDQKAVDLVKRADERLYEAKRAGRDRVCS